MQPIETHYAGHRFRSRLEARWAVFFDTLGLTWEYEPQGFVIGGGYLETNPYLPDFYLRDERLWVEVKGQLDAAALDRICHAVCAHGGLPLDPEGSPRPAEYPLATLLILGDIPRPTRSTVLHAGLRWWKGDVIVETMRFVGALRGRSSRATLASTRSGYPDGEVIWNDGPSLLDIIGGPSRLLQPIAVVDTPTLGAAIVGDAYAAARRARFEHGESG